MQIIDLLMINCAYFFAYHLTNTFHPISRGEIQVSYIVVCNLIWLFSSAIFGLYADYDTRKLERIYTGTWKSISLHLVLFTIFLFFSKDQEFSRLFLVVFYTILILFFIVNRFLETAVQLVVLKRFRGAKRVVVLGNNSTGTRLAAYLRKNKHVEFHGFLNIDDAEYFDDNHMVSSNIISEFQNAFDRQIDFIYVSIDTAKISKIPMLIEEAEKIGVRLKFIPDLRGSIATPFSLSYLAGEFPVISLRKEPLEDIAARFRKRAFDMVFSSLVIVFILSWLMPLIAILIKLDSKGPVFFLQNRTGRNNVNFKVFKFRTMTVTEEDEKFIQAKKGDSRITKIGTFLRKTSLDELPQFINVFQGCMSVVGPRPHPLLLNDHYQELIERYMVRHFVKPGITGWAQVNGYRGETSDPSLMECRVEHDIWYLENWTLMLDVKVVFMTVLQVAKGTEQAY